MSALNTAFKDFPLISLLIIAHIVSKIGNPNTIKGNTITAAVYVLAAPKIDITDNENPKKFEPVSPINVFAGVKLKGKNPTSAPAKAVINIIDINDEPFNTNITNNDIADITDIPDDNPSRPSIKLIAFVTTIIHAIVITIDEISCIWGKFINGNVIPSILIPDATTITAPNTCPINFVIGFIVLISSIIQNPDIVNIPNKNPNSFFQYACTPNKLIEFSMLITINK